MDGGAQFQGLSGWVRDDDTHQHDIVYVDPEQARKRDQWHDAGAEATGTPQVLHKGAIASVRRPVSFTHVSSLPEADDPKVTAIQRMLGSQADIAGAKAHREDARGRYFDNRWKEASRDSKEPELVHYDQMSKPTLGYWRSSPEHTAQAMTAVGVAAVHSRMHLGRFPEIDDSLSEQSAPIVRRLAERGVVTAPERNPRMVPTNSLSPSRVQMHGDLSETGDYGQGAQEPDWRVSHGRALIRAAMRPEKKRTPGAQFEQMKLF